MSISHWQFLSENWFNGFSQLQFSSIFPRNLQISYVHTAENFIRGTFIRFYKNCHFLTENSTDLLIFSWDLLISHHLQNFSLNSCHYCQELLFSVCQMRNLQFLLLTNLVDFFFNNNDNSGFFWGATFLVDFWISWL